MRGHRPLNSFSEVVQVLKLRNVLLVLLSATLVYFGAMVTLAHADSDHCIQDCMQEWQQNQIERSVAYPLARNSKAVFPVLDKYQYSEGWVYTSHDDNVDRKIYLLRWSNPTGVQESYATLMYEPVGGGNYICTAAIFSLFDNIPTDSIQNYMTIYQGVMEDVDKGYTRLVNKAYAGGIMLIEVPRTKQFIGFGMAVCGGRSLVVLGKTVESLQRLNWYTLSIQSDKKFPMFPTKMKDWWMGWQRR